MTNDKTNGPIAFQGAAGAYSDLACRQVFPNAKTLPCPTFDDAFAALTKGKAAFAMIPIENALAGRVGDVHHLLPNSDLYIVGEHFEPVHHCLLGLKSAKLKDITHVHSHIMALPQCRKVINTLGLIPVTHADTAGAAAQIATQTDPTQTAIASTLAAEIYGLKILKNGIQDHTDNITRFVILARKKINPPVSGQNITAFVFNVRHIPAALYKALGGFATNGINMLKVESYMDKRFASASFYCEVEGHPTTPQMKRAFEELAFFAENIKILGTFPKNPFRTK